MSDEDRMLLRDVLDIYAAQLRRILGEDDDEGMAEMDRADDLLDAFEQQGG